MLRITFPSQHPRIPSSSKYLSVQSPPSDDMSSGTTTGSEISAVTNVSSFSSSTRSLSEVSDVQFGLDLVSAARRTISFLRTVSSSLWLHHSPTLVESVRRYDELWMPLISDLTVGPDNNHAPMILPPVDIEWVWFCHTLNPVRYREYCELKFSRLIGKPAIFDEENEEYALMRCREIWVKRYPSEPFENEAGSDSESDVAYSGRVDEGVLEEVKKLRFLYSKFLEPYRSEIVYLIAARQRYRAFVSVSLSNNGGPVQMVSRLVPPSDVLLMLLTHQSYPTVYAEDMKEMERDMRKVGSVGDIVTQKEVEETKNLWKATFDQPYEKAGGEINFDVDGVVPTKPPFYWEVSYSDVNTKYKSMLPRFLLEVCVFTRLKTEMMATQEEMKRDVLRLRMARCHRELKLNKPISSFSKSWQKAWHSSCEFGTKGLRIELLRLGGYCFKAKTVEETATFHWNDLLRAPSLTLQRQIDQRVKIVASITPPVQAPYLLKCVPDRVTDDSGAMIADVILRMNQYRPQEGRWLSRTVLDHAGRECFVIRIRVGRGFWRRGGEAPSPVKWEDRIIEIREGSWHYVAGSIGRAPEKVVGTATPKEPPEQWKAAWQFSTGDELMLRWWEPSTSKSGLSFCVRNQSSESSVKLLKGRKMQYQTNQEERVRNEEDEKDLDDDEGFLTLVRFTDDDPNGRATALLNWKLSVVEFMPEEDASFVLLLCVSILRSVSDQKKEDLGRLLVRRRLKEARLGSRDWGSVVLHPSSCSPASSSPNLQPWYLNAEAVMVCDSADRSVRPAGFSYSPEEGSDQLYKRGIFT